MTTYGLVADTIPFRNVDGPGNRFAVFLQGCNLDCLACHNPHTMPRSTPRARQVTVEDLLDQVRRARRHLVLTSPEFDFPGDFAPNVRYVGAILEDPDVENLSSFVGVDAANNTMLHAGSLVDVAGVSVGHHTRADRPTGCSVVLCPQGAVAGVDVRAAAPGTRETDLLRPENTVQQVHAVLLTGGSAYGLDAAGGVMRWF